MYVCMCVYDICMCVCVYIYMSTAEMREQNFHSDWEPVPKQHIGKTGRADA